MHWTEGRYGRGCVIIQHVDPGLLRPDVLLPPSPAMVNYYDILKVSNKASRTEIKSAYRRLARKLHPDRNNGSEETALKFAAIAEAYEVLGNKDERAKYDRRLLDAQFNTNNGNTVFASTNPHAKRWRQMVYEKRYNDIIDRLIAEERRESIALQKFIFPVVALLMSMFVTGLVRPHIFLSEVLSSWAGNLVRITLISLCVAAAAANRLSERSIRQESA